MQIKRYAISVFFGFLFYAIAPLALFVWGTAPEKIFTWPAAQYFSPAFIFAFCFWLIVGGKLERAGISRSIYSALLLGSLYGGYVLATFSYSFSKVVGAAQIASLINGLGLGLPIGAVLVSPPTFLIIVLFRKYLRIGANT